MKKILRQHKWILTLLLFLIVSVASLYITDLNSHIWSFLSMNNDGRFHVMRIEGLYEAIRHGDWFPTVNMSFMGGFGYISNIFYSNLWLYPVAMLRMMGLDTVKSFIIFYIALNFCTFLTSFGSYYRASKNYGRSLVFSFCYTLSIYRIFDMVRRFDIGEVLTLVFLPIVLLGIYEVFYCDYKKWLYLTIGMVAVIYSHALSPVLIAIFMFWIVIFRLKTLIREPRRILSLFYAGLVSLALSLAYFLPIIEQLKHTKFKLTYDPLINVSQGGESFKNILAWGLENDIYKQNIGLVMLLVAIVIPFTVWKVKNKAVRDFAIIGEILLFMTTTMFPWKYFDKTPLNMIQFPWRLNMIVTILFSVFIAYDALNLFNTYWKKLLLVLVSLLLVVGAEQNLIKNYPQEYDTYTQFNNLNDYSIGGGEEYLPVKASLNDLKHESHIPQIKNGIVKIKNFRQNGSKVELDFYKANDAEVVLPIISYYGYSSKDSLGNVSQIKMDMDNNGLGVVKLNGSGKVRVNYYKTTIQKISGKLSIISLFSLILIVILKKRFKNIILIAKNK